MRTNREYDYFGDVLEYDYFALYSSTSMITQKILVLEYGYKYTSTITPSLMYTSKTYVFPVNTVTRKQHSFSYLIPHSRSLAISYPTPL